MAINIKGLYFAVALGAIPVSASADVGRIEQYLVGDEGIALAQDISALRDQIRTERLERSRTAETFSDIVGYCPTAAQRARRYISGFTPNGG